MNETLKRTKMEIGDAGKGSLFIKTLHQKPFSALGVDEIQDVLDGKIATLSKP